MRKDIFDSMLFVFFHFGMVGWKGKKYFCNIFFMISKWINVGKQLIDYLFNVSFFNSQVTYKVQLFQLHKNYRIEICYKILVSCFNPHRHYDAKGLGIGHIVL